MGASGGKWWWLAMADGWQTVVDNVAVGGSYWWPTMAIDNSRRQSTAASVAVSGRRWWTTTMNDGGW